MWSELTLLRDMLSFLVGVMRTAVSIAFPAVYILQLTRKMSAKEKCNPPLENTAYWPGYLHVLTLECYITPCCLILDI